MVEVPVAVGCERSTLPGHSVHNCSHGLKHACVYDEMDTGCVICGLVSEIYGDQGSVSNCVTVETSSPVMLCTWQSWLFAHYMGMCMP